MSVFVDTSALYAVLDADDDEHSRAVAEWHRLVRGAFPLVTTSYVLVETTALVQHRLGMDAARALDQDIRPVLKVEWIGEDLHATGMASMLAAGRRRLSLVDCVSFAFMSRAGLREVFAFDEHFAERGFSCIPSDALKTTEALDPQQDRESGDVS